jgi:hypothetical protein
MSSHEPCDPTLELLRGLPGLPPDAAAAARVRRRCHAAMARGAARHARRSDPSQPPGPGRLFDAVLMLSMSLYLAASVVEAVRVASSL